MKSCRIFVLAFLGLVLLGLSAESVLVIIVDPFFHYHKPLDGLFYRISEERSQNDGMTKHFEYDSLITGTSMTENFKTSEAEELFGGRFIKVPYSGGTYKEINDNLKAAFSFNKGVRLVIRSLDLAHLNEDKDAMRSDLGEYPTYLYDGNLPNDIKYLVNRDVLCLSIAALYSSLVLKKQGHTDFDEYANWMGNQPFGATAVMDDMGGRKSFEEPESAVALTAADRMRIEGNVAQNVTSLPEQNPRCMFCYFFPPYSIAWWGRLYEAGQLEKWVEAERTAIELILACENIRLYSFNTEFGITTDLDNYKDSLHYGEWINSLLLEYMKEGRGLLTKDNYLAYLDEERRFYLNFDYNSLFCE